MIQIVRKILNEYIDIEKVMNTPLKAISPQIIIDIEKSLMMGDVLEKISEVDINLEEIETEHPSLVKELDFKSQDDWLSPKSLSLNQLNKIKNSKWLNEDENLETSKTIQLLSDFIELKPWISNKNAGLGDLDQNYTPNINNLAANPINKVLEEVKYLLPKVDVDKWNKDSPLLFNYLNRHIDPLSNTISKAIESIPIK